MKKYFKQFYSTSDSLEYISFDILQEWKNKVIVGENYLRLINAFFDIKNINIEKVIKLRELIRKDYSPIFFEDCFLKNIKMNYAFFIFNLIIMDNENRIKLFEKNKNFFFDKNILKIISHLYENKTIILKENEKDFIIYNRTKDIFLEPDFNLPVNIKKQEQILINIQIIKE